MDISSSKEVNENLVWDKYISDCENVNGLSASEKIAAKNALLYLKELLGERFLPSWIPYGSQYCQKCGATQKKVVHNFTPSGRNRISTTKIVGVLLILLALYLMAKR